MKSLSDGRGAAFDIHEDFKQEIVEFNLTSADADFTLEIPTELPELQELPGRGVGFNSRGGSRPPRGSYGRQQGNYYRGGGGSFQDRGDYYGGRGSSYSDFGGRRGEFGYQNRDGDESRQSPFRETRRSLSQSNVNQLKLYCGNLDQSIVYRDLVEFFREKGIEVISGNVPSSSKPKILQITKISKKSILC